jgi:hypothetical protein
MANNIVAYAGIECFDLILYQARILSKMERKVLILENTDLGALKFTIPMPLGMDPFIHPITYRHIDFAIMALTTDLIELYDDIFISYGFYVPEAEYRRIVFTTDLYLHNMKKIIALMKHNNCEKYSLLVRNVIDVDVPSHLFEELGSDKDIDYIDFDEYDYENALLCQHYQSIRFSSVSRKTKKYLLKQIKLLYPDISKKTLNNAYKSAKGGK